jgi:Uma2 family endonuclease
MSTALRLTVEEYARLGETGAFDELGRRLELIHGEIREMPPSSPLHGDAVAFLTEWSVEATVGTDLKVQVHTDVTVGDSQPAPDLVWVARRRYRDRLPGPAEIQLVIHVADSSLAYDLSEKARLYAAEQIAEYWVVDLAARLVHVHRQPDGETYASVCRVPPGEPLAPACRPAASVDLAALFASE